MHSFAVALLAASATTGGTIRTRLTFTSTSTIPMNMLSTTATTTFTPGFRVTSAPRTTSPSNHFSGGRRLNTYVAKLGETCSLGCWGSDVCYCSPMTCACGGADCNWDCAVLPANATKKHGVVECADGFETCTTNLTNQTVICVSSAGRLRNDIATDTTVPPTTTSTTFTPGFKVTPAPRTTIPAHNSSGGRRKNTYVAKLGETCLPGCWGGDVCYCSPMACACGGADCNWDCAVLPPNATKKHGVVECADGFEAGMSSLANQTATCLQLADRHRYDIATDTTVPPSTTSTTFTPGLKVELAPRTTIPARYSSGGRRKNTYVAKLGETCLPGCWGGDVCYCSPMTCACGGADCNWDCVVLPPNSTKKHGVVECADGFEIRTTSQSEQALACVLLSEH